MKNAAAILFDLDGTLTRPVLDFGAIREELALPAGVSILDGIAQAERDDPPRGQAMRAVLDRHEREGAEATQPNDGALELLDRLTRDDRPWAVVTRNATTPARVALRILGHPDAILVSREDAIPKPDPAPVHLACRHLGLTAAQTWMVGDYADDITAGQAAGCEGTVLLTNRRPPAFISDPSLTVATLHELFAYL